MSRSVVRTSRVPSLVVVSSLLLFAACSSSKGTAGGSSTTTSGATGVSATSTTTSGATSTGAASTATAPTTDAPISETCPSASVVNAALGTSYGAPVSTSDTFGLTCTYGTGVATRIRFQKDTTTTFAAGKAAVGAAAVPVSGLGDAAYAVSGFIDVLKGSVAVRITAPLASTAQVETLAHKIVG